MESVGPNKRLQDASSHKYNDHTKLTSSRYNYQSNDSSFLHLSYFGSVNPKPGLKKKAKKCACHNANVNMSIHNDLCLVQSG